MRKRQRLTAALVLTLGLAALPAAAAGQEDRSPSAGQALAGVWAWIAERLPIQETPDEGWAIDPNGSTAAPDEGWAIDPDGSTAADLPSSDQSLYIDPNG